MFFLLTLTLSFLVRDESPPDLEVRCVDGINKTFPICEKIAKDKQKLIGSACFKYFSERFIMLVLHLYCSF